MLPWSEQPGVASFFGNDDTRVAAIGTDAADTANWGGSTLDSHHVLPLIFRCSQLPPQAWWCWQTFIVRYRPDEDRHLDMHVDECDVTFNFGLTDEGFEGMADLLLWPSTLRMSFRAAWPVVLSYTVPLLLASALNPALSTHSSARHSEPQSGALVRHCVLDLSWCRIRLGILRDVWVRGSPQASAHLCKLIGHNCAWASLTCACLAYLGMPRSRVHVPHLPVHGMYNVCVLDTRERSLCAT